MVAATSAVTARPAPSGSAARTGMALAALGVLGFSFSIPLTKLAVGGIDPMLVALGRAAVAGILAAAALLLRRAPRPAKGQWGRLALVGAGVVFGFPVLSSYALQHTPAGHGSLVTGLLPLATAGVAVARAGERPSLRYWTWSVVGLAAVVAYVVAHGGGRLHPADAMLLLAVLAAGLGYAEGAILSRELPAWVVISWALVICLPITVPVAAVLAAVAPEPTVAQLAAFAYLSVVSMFLGFVVWYAGLARAGIARAGQLQLAQPMLALVWGWPLVGERLDTAAVVTSVVVLVAVVAGRQAPIRYIAGGPGQGRSTLR